MKSRKVWICVVLLAGMVVSRGVWADQMVQPGDVVDPEGSPTYTYTLSFADLATNATTFADDFVSTNLVVSRSADDSNRFVVATAGATNAEASIVFDFSESGFRPSYVEFIDSLYSYTPDEERVQQTSAYSVNGTDWITLNSLNQGQGFRSIRTNMVALGQAERVYYRVTATVLAEDNDGVFTDERNQWNRVPAGEPFKASFSLVEPAIAVGPGDVVDPETNPVYSYTLGFDDIGAGFNKFTDDFYFSNFRTGVNSNDSIRFIVAEAGKTSAETIIVWDFEESGFAPAQAVFRDSLFAYNDLENVQQTTAYSIDGTNWTTISSLNRFEQAPTWNVNNTNGVVALLNRPHRVYYRVLFEVLPGDDDGVFTSERTQWNRVPNGQALAVDFTLAEPEKTVRPGDVQDPETNPSYTYSLTTGDMAEGETKFIADFTSINMAVGRNNDDTTRFVAAVAGNTYAEAVIVWNFEPSGFAPTNVVFSDSLWALSTDLEHVQQRTEFSVNGTDWTEISSLNRYEQKPTWNAQAIGVSFTLDQPDRVYYRVTFEVLENDDDGVFTSERNQWNRTVGQTLVAQFGLSEQTGEEPGVSLEDFVFPAMGSVSVSFLSENGVEYALEYTTDLAADPQIWTPATGDNATQTGDGNVLTLEDDDPSGSLRIYRVVTP